MKMSKVFDTSVLIKYRKERNIMPVGAIIFLAVVLVVFLVLDIIMLVSLLRPGDERNQIIAWKASSFTLLAMVGANILILSRLVDTFFSRISLDYAATSKVP